MPLLSCNDGLPLRHYQTFGRTEKRNPSGSFIIRATNTKIWKCFLDTFDRPFEETGGLKSINLINRRSSADRLVSRQQISVEEKEGKEEEEEEEGRKEKNFTQFLDVDQNCRRGLRGTWLYDITRDQFSGIVNQSKFQSHDSAVMYSRIIFRYP